MEEMWKIQKPSMDISPDNDDIWKLSRQGSAVPPKTDPTFYYSHEQRLEHSSRTVRKLHEPESNSRRGRGFHLFGGLARHSSSKVVLLSILVFFLFISFINFFTEQMAIKRLGGNAIAAEALRSNGETTIIINKSFKEENVGAVYNGMVDVVVGPSPRPQASIRRNPFAEKEVVVDEDHPVVVERLEFTFEPEEVYELVLPYEAPDFLLIMQINEEERIILRLQARRPLSLFGIELPL